jgi:hypothetical protein
MDNKKPSKIICTYLLVTNRIRVSTAESESIRSTCNCNNKCKYDKFSSAANFFACILRIAHTENSG